MITNIGIRWIKKYMKDNRVGVLDAYSVWRKRFKHNRW
jgi:hypothetical protein